ncbi:MAG: hypothetical protein II006_03400 [Peptostreptococcaceae bacterium]|nr:hypothetical protein [Peptostreptococcaceae bacterium]
MNKFENIRVMLREAQKEINELENIAINFSAEIEKQNGTINEARDYIESVLYDEEKDRQIKIYLKILDILGDYRR